MNFIRELPWWAWAMLAFIVCCCVAQSYFFVRAKEECEKRSCVSGKSSYIQTGSEMVWITSVDANGYPTMTPVFTPTYSCLCVHRP